MYFSFIIIHLHDKRALKQKSITTGNNCPIILINYSVQDENKQHEDLGIWKLEKTQLCLNGEQRRNQRVNIIPLKKSLNFAYFRKYLKKLSIFILCFFLSYVMGYKNKHCLCCFLTTTVHVLII